MLKNFIITGGSGFIGSHFIDLLLSKNLNVINVDLKKDYRRAKNKYYKFKQGNICDLKFLNKIITKKLIVLLTLLLKLMLIDQLIFQRFRSK